MTQQGASVHYADWEKQQSQQYRQVQCGYLDLPYVPYKKNKTSTVKKDQVQTKVVKVWHEGAD